MQDGQPGHVPAASWDHQSHGARRRGGSNPCNERFLTMRRYFWCMLTSHLKLNTFIKATCGCGDVLLFPRLLFQDEELKDPRNEPSLHPKGGSRWCLT